MSRFRIPTLSNPNVVVRLAADSTEVEQANRLVFANYVAAGFWENDENKLRTNRFLHTSKRHVFVVLEDGQLVGTMSIILDSADGLPSDEPQPAAMQRLRENGGTLAEVSAFAMDQSKVSNRKLVLFLISYMFQYSLYYAGIDRLVASCISAHADFYESVLCFSKIGNPIYYAYTRVVARLLSLELAQTQTLYAKYLAKGAAGETCYRFMFSEAQACHQFPSPSAPSRPNQVRGVRRDLAKVA